MPRSRRVPVMVAVVVAVVATLLGASPAAAAPPDRPGAVVVLGDSAASGEGADDYLAGTRGEGGDWCHRSTHAYVNQTGLAPVAINLACSGARSADVGFGAGHYTEGGQAQQLVAVARRYRVATVVLQVGANDDAAITATGEACILAFLDITVPPCRQTVGPLVAARMAATAPKVEAAVHNVRTAMSRAGYAQDSYVLVLASYASPITENMVALQGLRGCPYSRADAQWGRTTLFPALAATLRGVAGRTGARFLDLARASEGFEACSHSRSSQEWQRRLTVDAGALVYGGLDAIGFHLAQESFHPSAIGHAEIGHCLGDFVRSASGAGACLPGADGHLHLDRGAVPVPAAA